MTRAMNLVTRIRVMSEGILSLREELRLVRADLTALQDATARTTAEMVLRNDDVGRRLDDVGRRLDDVRAAAGRGARRGTLARRALRVVFLVHNKDAWDSIGEVVQIMRSRDDFDPIVVSIPHHYGGDAPPKGEGRVHRFLTDRDVPHLRLRKAEQGWASELIHSLDPDIVFRQSQWDADVDPAFTAENLAWTRLALIPYETMNPTRNVPWDEPAVDSALDQHWHRAAWLVFCANDDVLAIARRQTVTGGRQYRAVGHPKADALRRTVPAWPLEGAAPSRRRILWSAHHSILDGWNDFGLFPSTSDEMLRWAREEPGIDFVFAHHPYLADVFRRPESPVDSASFSAWLEEWTRLPNTAYWRGEYAPVLAAADLVVSDGPSMITESQVLPKPTIFLERDGHVQFNSIGEMIIQGVHRVNDVASARIVAESILSDGDPLAEIQRQTTLRLFGEPGAAQRIVDVIVREAADETARI